MGTGRSLRSRAGLRLVVAALMLLMATAANAQLDDASRARLYRGGAVWRHAFAECGRRYPGGAPDDKFSAANLCAHWIGDQDMTMFDACAQEMPNDLLAEQLCVEKVFAAWIDQRRAKRPHDRILSEWAAAERQAEQLTESDVRANFGMQAAGGPPQ